MKTFRFPRLKSRFRSAAVALTALLSGVVTAPAVQVDTELVILVDVSGSINFSEHNAMMEGIAQSFESSEVLDSIQSGSLGSIAATLVFWAGNWQQSVGVSWMEVSDATSAAQFATSIRGAPRPFFGPSAVGSAITYATELFGDETGNPGNGFESENQIITVVADGIDNNTPPFFTSRAQNLQDRRDDAIAQGVDEISALVVNHPTRDLATYYTNNVIASPSGEAEVVMFDLGPSSQAGLNAGVASIISPVPEPTSAMLCLIGGLFAFCRRRR